MFFQSSYQVTYHLFDKLGEIDTNCTDSPCEFDVTGDPGDLYAISVYALQQSIRSEAATIQHNTGILQLFTID